MARAVAAGLQPGPKEYGTNHVHAHLDVFVDGTPVIVPAGIGIDITNPDVKTFDDPPGKAYGGIDMCAVPCISPLHTHDASGVLHTESRVQNANTLGEFFVEWGVPLTATCVADLCDKPVTVYIDGKQFNGDPNGIELTNAREIAIVIGTPPARIPSTGDFSKA